MSIREEFPSLTELERACKLLDELLCLNDQVARGAMPRNGWLEMIAAARQNNPDYPITVWLSDFLKDRGLLSGKKTVII